MENNEQIEETQVEETQETATDAEQVEDQDGQEETKDWKAEAKKYKAIARRQDKKLQEKSSEVEENLNKTNTEQNVPTMEDMVLVNKGLSIEEVTIVKDSAKVLGIPVLEAYDHDIVQAKINEDRQQAQVKANSLPASTGSAPAPRAKTVGNMSDEEHQALWERKNKEATHK